MDGVPWRPNEPPLVFVRCKDGAWRPLRGGVDEVTPGPSFGTVVTISKGSECRELNRAAVRGLLRGCVPSAHRAMHSRLSGDLREGPRQRPPSLIH